MLYSVGLWINLICLCAESCDAMQAAIVSIPKIINKLRCRTSPRHQQIIPCAGAGDIKQVSLCIVYFFKISIVRHCFDPALKGNYLVITCHYDNGTKLQAFGVMHGADRNLPAGCFNGFIKHVSTCGRPKCISYYPVTTTKMPPFCRWFPSSSLGTQSGSSSFPCHRNLWKRLEAELHGPRFPSWSLGTSRFRNSISLLLCV